MAMFNSYVSLPEGKGRDNTLYANLPENQNSPGHTMHVQYRGW